MRQYRKISAFFFMSIFSMLMLHEILPHVHHQHDHPSVSTEVHDHAHQHDDGEKDKPSPISFLHFLIGEHAHTLTSNSFEAISSSTYLKVKGPGFHTILSLQGYVDGFFLSPGTVSYYPPYFPLAPHLSTLFLRGPPVLG